MYSSTNRGIIGSDNDLSHILHQGIAWILPEPVLTRGIILNLKSNECWMLDILQPFMLCMLFFNDLYLIVRHISIHGIIGNKFPMGI